MYNSVSPVVFCSIRDDLKKTMPPIHFNTQHLLDGQKSPLSRESCVAIIIIIINIIIVLSFFNKYISMFVELSSSFGTNFDDVS